VGERVGPLRIVFRAVLVGALAVGLLYLWSRAGYLKKAWIESPSRMAALAAVPNTTPGWPPVEGQPFPEVPLVDHLGRPFSMASLRGRPVLVELVSMTCAGCQAWSGGGERGAFDGLASQEGLPPIERTFGEWTGHELHGGELSFVQLVVYDTALEPPTPEALAAWRDHFGLVGDHTRVVTGGAGLANVESMRRIPGFLWLDADGTVVVDAAGPASPHDLYDDLLPIARAALE
jgi:hypothetical protein